MKPNRLTPDEWEANKVHIGSLSTDTVETAYAVLVEGLSQSDVARARNWSRQKVQKMIARYFNAIKQVPSHWQSVTVWLPPEDAKEVRALEKRRLAELRQEK